MLAVDRATVAVEVPVFLTPGESRRLLGANGGVLGHIDFLQVFGGTVTILDYKPEAAKDRRAAGQVALYALMLSVRTGIHLRDI